MRCALAIAGACALAGAAWADERPGGKDEGSVRLGGRVFFRAAAFDESADGGGTEESVASARVQARYRHGKWLRAVVEAELAGKPELKDAFVLLRRRGAAVRAGQFKPPVSAIELESAWTLPGVGRGLMNDILVDRLQIAGRRPGLQLEWNGAAPLRPGVHVGVFQPSDPDGDLIDDAGAPDRNAAARLAVRPGPVAIGAFAEVRSSRPLMLGSPERFWAAGLDATVEVAFTRHAVRAWADALAGSSWFRGTGATGEATFVAGRAIGAWRAGGLDDGQPYAELFAAVSLMDPDLDTENDLAYEATVGVNLGAWDRARLTVQAEARRFATNTPTFQRVNVTGDEPLGDRTALVVQVGAAF